MNKKYLIIPHGPEKMVKETIKLFLENGARFDGRRWYIPEGVDEKPFKDFISPFN